MKNRSDFQDGIYLWRLGLFCSSDHELQQMLKAAENVNPDRAAQMVPVILSGAECAPAMLIERLAQLKDLVDKKCQQNKLEKIKRGILRAMAIIVLSVVALIFQGIEIFVFNFPPAAATDNEGFDIVLIDWDVSDPTGMKVCFAGSLDGVIKKIDVLSPGRPV